MQDPRDPGTLDLVEACKRPLTPAERQKRRRLRLKQKRAAGQLYDLQLTGDELDAIRAALGRYVDEDHGIAGFGDVAELMWRRLTCLRVGKYYEGDPVWSAEAIREGVERVRDYLASRPRGSLSPDDFGCEWLSLRDRGLLKWARRNEQLVRNATPEQAYPDDPKMRNMLGKALNDMQALSHRHQMLLEQARELSQMAFDAGLKPRLSSPASLLRDLRRHEELYDVNKLYPAD